MADFQDILYSLLNSGQQRHPGIGGGMPETVNRLVAPQAPAPQNALAGVMQGGGAPSPMQQPQQAEPAPQGGGGGFLAGLGNLIQDAIDPQARGRNMTIDWLQNQGLDPGTATLLAGNKPALQKYLLDRQKGADPMDALKLEKTQLEIENMRNPTTDDVREYNFARQQGYTGNFIDYMQDMRKSGATNVTVGGGKFGTIPQGYMLQEGPEGARLVAIPGGPAEAEMTAAEDKADLRVGNALTASEVATTAASRARKAVEKQNFGPAGTSMVASLPVIGPMTDSAEVVRQVDVLKNMAAAENLNAMRQSSPTGGALGNVTEKELKLLQDKSGALDPNSPTFLRDLDDYERTLLRTIHGKQVGDQIFAQTRDDPPSTDNKQPTAPKAPPAIGETRYGYRFKGGDPSEPSNWEKAN